MKEYIELRPKYFGDFHCIGGTCTVSCCRDWGYISWSGAEHDKLMNASMSDGLREKLIAAFKEFKNPDTNAGEWNIIDIPDEKTGRRSCPILTEDGWCSIQKELGAEYLSYTCMNFPRLGCNSSGVITKSCSGACPEVLNILLNDREAMKLAQFLKNDDIHKVLCNAVDSADAVAKTPFLSCRGEIIDLMYSLVSDEKYSPETGMVLGAIAAKMLSELSRKGEPDSIPDEARRLKDQLGGEAQTAQINGIAPNYKIKLGVMSEVFMAVSSGIKIQSVIRELTDGEGMLVVEKYNEAEKKLSAVIGERTWFFRNLYLNTLLELNIMCFGRAKTIYDFWLYYCACCSMLKLTAASAALNAENPERSVTDQTAVFFRQIGHIPDMMRLVLDILKKHNCESPAHIALMLK